MQFYLLNLISYLCLTKMDQKNYFNVILNSSFVHFWRLNGWIYGTEGMRSKKIRKSSLRHGNK